MRRAICKNPCLLNNPFLQYDHFPENESAWLNDFNKVFGTFLHIGMAPAAIGAMVPITADMAGSVFINFIRELVKLKGKDFIIGFTFDLLVQRAIHDVFNADKPFVLDYPQALASAVESTISLKSAIGEVAVSAALECFVSGHFDDGKIRDDFDVQACAKGALWATLIQGGLKGAGYGLRQIPKDKFIDGLIDLIASKDPSLLRAGPFDDHSIWSIYKLFNPVPLKADDIQHLFNTSRLDETTDTWIDAINDPAIQKTLLDEGFYLKFRKLEGVTNEERKEMLRELLARAKVDGDGGKKAVGEWEVKIIPSSLVASLSSLQKAIHFRLIEGGTRFIENDNIIKYLDEKGDEFARIENDVFSVSKNKGSIPEPSSYLDADYIRKHVDKFKNEGAGFIVVKSWIEGGNPLNITLPPRKFVGLLSEMDAIIAKYKTLGNDWTVLRDELNLGTSTDLSSEEIFYVKITGNYSRFNYDIPNVNEVGAIIGEWVPGGYTKSGTTEAVLIGAENIIHNKNVVQLLNNFTGQWEKLK